MHIAIEKARKTANIGSLAKNYPVDPKQRGCGYWAAFLGSIGNDLASMDAAQLKSEKEKTEILLRCTKLERELSEARKCAAKNCVELIGEQEGWDESKISHNTVRMIG
jgi:hypothetical protein